MHMAEPKELGVDIVVLPVRWSTASCIPSASRCGVWQRGKYSYVRGGMWMYKLAVDDLRTQLEINCH